MSAQPDFHSVSEGQAAIIRLLAQQAAQAHIKERDNAGRRLRPVQQRETRLHQY